MISIRNVLRLSVILLVMLDASCFGQAQTDFERECDKLAKSRGKDTERLHKLFKLDWEHTMVESPEFATEVGYAGQNHRWTDNSLDAIARRKRELQSPLKVIKSINRNKLAAPDQLSYDLFRKNYEVAVEGTRFPAEYFQITQLSGVQQDLARYMELSPHSTVKDYEDLVARLNGIPTAIDQAIVLLKKGQAAEITPARIALRNVPQQAKDQTEPDPAKNSLLLNFRTFPAEFSDADRSRFTHESQTALRDKVIPAFNRLHDFLAKEYLPGARETIAMGELPDGKAWYEYNARVSTTTSLTPEQIHEIGLAEVKRIRVEMDKVIAQAQFKGSFDEFLVFLRKDPQFYYTSAEDLLRGYRDICKRADPELARLFGKLPRLPYGVVAVPGYAEESQTTAYYQPGSPEAGRPGYYYANTSHLDTRPKWEMEALSLHEAVPGHHFQIALSQELEAVPEFRKHGGYTAFVEGWGLYAESLGPEMGFYKDPYMKFGQLVYEMWRAIRLVVDTGMHSKGWTRQQAIDYFLANASKNEHDVTVEVDRYIVWPGQALAYKIGELKIKELRAYATKELGAKFDIRQFHDQVLGNAALPLDVLEVRIKDWVRAQKSSKPVASK
ncbi:MAG TPA: DUF885 family protein [Verrucomicrobiae bacterium]|nr:DUF885 family protein [Verrucomicrobiae bacterium]